MSRPKAVTEPVILELEKRYRDGATTLECIKRHYSGVYILRLSQE